jgi:hypothetical protein
MLSTTTHCQKVQQIRTSVSPGASGLLNESQFTLADNSPTVESNDQRTTVLCAKTACM